MDLRIRNSNTFFKLASIIRLNKMGLKRRKNNYPRTLLMGEFLIDVQMNFLRHNQKGSQNLDKCWYSSQALEWLQQRFLWIENLSCLNKSSYLKIVCSTRWWKIQIKLINSCFENKLWWALRQNKVNKVKNSNKCYPLRHIRLGNKLIRKLRKTSRANKEGQGQMCWTK